MPPFIERAKGCRVWDLDGREYIDYRCALGPIILGYCYPEVDATVRKQMDNGVLFSMASPLELQAAETIIENVPWLEQIRFMKTGADACTACVRLARVMSGREHILTSGYHGYHDCFALSWPNPGVPEVLRDYVHEIDYNDIDAANRVFADYGDKLAAVIVEPYNWGENIGVDFLKTLREKCDKYGVVLIFDEVLTGFRLAHGGAQEYFGVTPDLVAYAKALANGYPVSIFAGKEKYMRALDKTIITTTYAGETLSLAACKATMEIMHEQPVHQHIFAMGNLLKSGFAEIIDEFSLPARAAGLPPAPFIRFTLDNEDENQRLRDKLFSGLFEKGIFPNDRWFVNYSHRNEDIEQTLDAVHDSLKQI